MPKKLKTIQSKEIILILASFLIPFYTYCYTLCPTVSVYADAGEFPFAAYVGSFGHPPGFPLFILIIKLFQLLPYGNPALKANLAAAFISAITLPLFFLLMRLIIKNSFISFVSTLILAFSKIYWKNALVSEVFGLLTFFIVVTFLLFLLWIKTKKKIYFYLFLIACGFGLGHHQLIIATLLPLLFWFLIAKKWRYLVLKDYIFAPFLVAIGFLPYLYIFNAAKNWPLMNWEKPRTINGLFRLITRASYGTFILTSSTKKVLFLPQTIGVIKLLANSFTLPAFLLFLAGLLVSFKKNRKIFSYSLFVIILIGFAFSMYSHMPLDDLTEIPYLERFQIIPSVFIAILIGFGLNLFPIPKTLLLILPLLVFVLNFNQVNQRNNYFGEYLAQDLLVKIPENSIFLFEGDAIINSLFYHRFVLGKDTKIAYIINDMLVNQSPWYLEEIKKLYPDLILPQKASSPVDYFNQFIAYNSEKKDIFFLIPNFEFKYQLSIPKIPKGLVWKIPSPKDEFNFQNLEKEIIQDYKNYKNFKNINFENLLTDSPKESSCGCEPTPTPILLPFPQTANIQKYPHDWPEATLLANYSVPLMLLAQINHEDLNKVEKYYFKAIEISPYNYQIWIELGDDYLMHQQKERAIASWENALKTIPEENLAKIIKEKIKKAKNEQ